MHPAIAQTAICRYSQPGELVVDPMCEIGTTLVEAVHLDRDAIGVEREPRWANLARDNLAHATTRGATGTGSVVCGDARQLLDTAGITPAPRQVTAAHTRRSSTDQQLTLRATELGFASLRAYLTDRVMTRRWPGTSIAGELRVHPATVRDRLDQHRLPRQADHPPAQRSIQRQTACWAAKRHARLAELGFADPEDYLRVRRVEQGWSLRRMLAVVDARSCWIENS
jgi:hypothetical protein